ncbi:MAG: glutamine--fructose-6-phosphate transaminase (isomerizing) [Dehalococcoidia bacterium]
MCGIIGYTGGDQAAQILLDGLARLEYRGYDSAGIAVLDGDELAIEKRAGKLGVLQTAVEGRLPEGTVGIGHTRWATHGGVTDANAHPHLDCSGKVVVIHNGIVENFAVLRDELLAAGHRFVSETDSEVIAHLIESERAGGVTLVEAVRRSIGRLEGAAALVVLCRDEPDRIVAARVSNAGAVVIGYGDGEMLVASDLPALLKRTRRVAYLHHGEIARVTREGVSYIDADGAPLDKAPVSIAYDFAAAEKGPYRHFMQKEIFEQPTALLDTLRQHADLEAAALRMDAITLTRAQIDRIKRVVLVGMGTSMHAAMVGRAYFERIAGLPAEVDNASEFRYRRPVIGPDTLVISVAQSGETVDTLAAMEEAGRHHALLATVCNVEGAQTTRVADATVLTRCGPEIGVASTKTFTAAMSALYLLATWIGYRQYRVSSSRVHDLIEDVKRIPNLLARVLDAAHGEAKPYEALARKYGAARDVLFLGRGMQYPLAMEGALKLKEISYIHAEGYPAGEMKHGPIALIDRELPVVVLAPRDSLYDKMVSNIQQIQARQGRTIAIATEGDARIAALAEDIIWTPPAPELLLPLVTAIPVQLLAYEIATLRGNDVDQPRNLAKTVTVE